MRKSFAAIGLICSITLFCSCAGPEKSGLFQFPLGEHDVKEFQFSDDENSVKIEVTERVFKMQNFNFRTHPIVVSRNGRNFAYAAVVENTRRAAVVLNGIKVDEYSHGVSPVVFSPDSRHYFYNAREGAKTFPVLDGSELSPGDFQVIQGVAFTPDSVMVAFEAAKSGAFDAKKYVLFNGKEFGPYVDIKTIKFSPDSKRIAFTEHVSTDGGDTDTILVDGEKIGTYGGIKERSIGFTEDSGKLTFFYMKDKKWYFASGKENFGPFDEVRISNKRLAKDSESFVFCARRRQNWHVITRDGEYGPFEEKLGAIISADGTKVVYTGKKYGKYSIYLNEESLGETAPGDWPYLGEDGSFLYTLTEGKNKKVYLDGELLHEFSFDNETNVLIFDYNKETGDFVIIRNEDGMTVVVDGLENKTYPHIGRFINDDKGNYAYWAYTTESNGILVINGVETLRSNRSGFPMAFGEDGRLYGALVYTNPYLKPSGGGPASWWKKEIENMRFILFEVDIKK